VALAPARRGLLRRYLRRTLVGVVAALAGVFVVLPVAFAIVVNHKARAPVGEVDLGRPHIDVTLTTSDGVRFAGPRRRPS
jgi:hypothetical protein